MKKLLLLSLIPLFQLLSAQINFAPQQNHGFEPYTATLSGIGTIFYTTDGTDANVNSPLGINNVTINITETIKVKAILKDDSNQWSEIFAKTFYFGPFPVKDVYFKKPPMWNSACSFANSQDPQTTVDFFSGFPMTSVCEGWLKATHSFFVGSITFDNCANLAPPPIYQYYNIVTEDTVFYDYSEGPITNPPACLLALDDSKKVAMIIVYPNPVQDFVTVESEIKFSTYEIIDATGKSFPQKQFSENSIDVSHLPAGVYFIKFNSASKSSNLVRFIKK